MPIPILKTKLHPPELRPRLVARQTILPAISAGLRDGRKLTLISAPAGFGKTTLARAWLDASGLPVAWLSLEESEANPEQFLAYLVAALQTVIASVGADLLHALETPQPPAPATLLDSLLNELSLNEDPFILALDDYHLVDSKPVDDLLNRLVERLPPRLHLLITTREDPLLPLARLRARNQLTEIRAADLRFNEAEAAEFLNRVMGLNLSPDEVAALEKRTEGWIAGLQLAALSLQGKTDTAAFIRSFGGTNQFILDYLLEEVLHKQPPAAQEFLLRTSILSRLNGALCDAVLQAENPSAQEMLESLERDNLFVIPLDEERRWYRYHHLFRDLLRQRLGQKQSQAEIAEIHIRASLWFEQNGEMGEAFQHALSAEDVERAARLAEIAWLGMDETFQTVAWLGWVNQLSVGVRRLRPVLLTQIGWAHMDAGNAILSESSLRDAEASLKRPREELVIVEAEQFRTLSARIAFARAYNAQTQNRFADVVKHVETALDIIPHDDQYMQAQALSILSATYWANGELDKAYGLMSGWVDAAQQAGNFVFAIAASFGKADILITQGRLRDAMQVYQTALSLAAEHGAEQHTAHHHLGLGLLHHEMGEDERAAHHLQKAFELGRQTTIVDWMYRKSLAQAYLKESEGDYDAALMFLNEAGRVYVRTPIPNLRPVEAMQARIHLKQNHLNKAQAWGHTSGLSLQDAPIFLHEFGHLTLARIVLAENQNDRHFQTMLHMLDALLKQAESPNHLRSRIDILITQALAYSAKDSTKALAALEQALTLAEPEGYLRLFVNEGETMAELLSKVKSSKLQQYANRILAALTPSIQPASFNIQPLIDPLSERELEVLRLIAQGLSNQEITQKLVVALSTVKGHNLRIFAKLQAKSRTEAVARARELGIL
jgi:LuxR family transcriptional regulator, maltose regulon positive regulatory protein